MSTPIERVASEYLKKASGKDVIIRVDFDYDLSKAKQITPLKMVIPGNAMDYYRCQIEFIGVAKIAGDFDYKPYTEQFRAKADVTFQLLYETFRAGWTPEKHNWNSSYSKDDVGLVSSDIHPSLYGALVRHLRTSSWK